MHIIDAWSVSYIFILYDSILSTNNWQAVDDRVDKEFKGVLYSDELYFSSSGPLFTIERWHLFGLVNQYVV